MNETRLRTAARIALTLVGGYAATAGVVALLALLLKTTMSRSEATTIASIIGFFLYLTIILWGFHERRLLRLAFALSTAVIVAVAVVRNAS